MATNRFGDGASRSIAPNRRESASNSEGSSAASLADRGHQPPCANPRTSVRFSTAIARFRLPVGVLVRGECVQWSLTCAAFRASLFDVVRAGISWGRQLFVCRLHYVVLLSACESRCGCSSAITFARTRGPVLGPTSQSGEISSLSGRSGRIACDHPGVDGSLHRARFNAWCTLCNRRTWLCHNTWRAHWFGCRRI